MKSFLLFLSFLIIISVTGFSQTLIWSDDFETTAANWTLNTTPTPNDPNANIWEINDNEGGIPPPGCAIQNNGNRTLHVTCQGIVCLNTGAVYFAGDGGSGIAPGTTDKRAELNTPISTLGETQLQLEFDWMGMGQANIDFAELEYSTDGGNTWIALWSQLPGAVCPGGEGVWMANVVALPPAAENIPDLRFAFRWRNNNDAQGIDPSFAVDNMALYSSSGGTNPGGQTTAAFNATSFNICEGDCINFIDASTGANLSNWVWMFTGANIQMSTDQNPTNVCFPTAGTYAVTLTVNGDNGQDQTTQNITVTNCTNPGPGGGNLNANFSIPQATVCQFDCINFSDLSSGNNITDWFWEIEGANVQTTTDQNPQNICFITPGIHNIKLTVTNSNGETKSETKQIEVIACNVPPTAAFTIDTNIICAGDCVSFTDVSTESPYQWTWLFDGARPQYSIQQNPSNICYDSPGVYNVTLTVTNVYGTSTYTNTIHVRNLPSIVAQGDTTIDMSGIAKLTAIPISAGSIFWEPEDEVNCNICPNIEVSPMLSTTYYAYIVDNSGCVGRDSVNVNVNFREIIDVPSAFSPNNDGENDRLYVLGLGIRNIDFKIYNRYGQLVFQSTDVKHGWNGTMNGQSLNQGVFAYTLDYELIDGTRGKKSGNVTLIR